MFVKGNRVHSEECGDGTFIEYYTGFLKGWVHVDWDDPRFSQSVIPSTITFAPAPPSPLMATTLEQRLTALEAQVAQLVAWKKTMEDGK